MYFVDNKTKLHIFCATNNDKAFFGIALSLVCGQQCIQVQQGL